MAIIRGIIQRSENRLKNIGISKGKVGHTTRRIRKELLDLAERSPGFAPVRVHSAVVKRLGNAVVN
jgi:hypothetical protein